MKKPDAIMQSFTDTFNEETCMSSIVYQLNRILHGKVYYYDSICKWAEVLEAHWWVKANANEAASKKQR